MNCFFCNAPVKAIHCENQTCQDVSVCHFLRENPDDPDGDLILYKAEFNVKINNKCYFISYVISPRKNEEKHCRIHAIMSGADQKSAWFETVLVLPFDANITTTNAIDKLKLYLTFS